MINKITVFVVCMLSGVAQASSIQIQDVNIKIKGGVSASALYFENPGFLKRHDSYILNDALLEIEPEEFSGRQFRFYGGFGILQKQGIGRIYAPLPPVDIELHYGWLEVPTYNDRHIEIGQLITRLGYESPVSYKNNHGLMGAVWSGQPNLYPGIRFNGPLASLKYYIEVTNDSTIGDASAAVGVFKEADNYRYSASYYEAIDERRMIDLMYSKQLGNIALGINLDYHALLDPVAGQDENAVGMALYVNYVDKQWHWPVRLEYIDDGNTGIYEYGSGYTVTFSPTYHYSKSQFIRAELVAAKGDRKPFRNSDGGFEENQYIATLQAGMRF